MNYIPLFFDLKNKAVLVVGGGEIAERKIHLLLKAHACVTVISPTVTALCLQWQSEKKLHIIIGTFTPELLSNKWFVVAATNDPTVNALVFKEANQRHIFCNAVDDTIHCSSIIPSIVDRSPLMIAISSEGNAPVLARSIREKLESELSANIGAIAKLAGELRPKVNNMIAPSFRRHFWAFFFKEMQSKNRKPDLSTEEKRHNFILKYKFSKVDQGAFSIIEFDKSNIDSLTLKAIREMQSADLILTFEELPEEIEHFIRRDCSILKIKENNELFTKGLHCLNENLHVIGFVDHNKLKELERHLSFKEINVI